MASDTRSSHLNFVESAHRGPFNYGLIFAGLAGLAAALTLLIATESHGLGVSPDSVIYLSSGRNLAEGSGLRTYSGEDLTTFPPMIPGLVSFFETLGISAIDAMRFVNSLAFGVAVFLTTLWLSKRLNSWPLVIAGAASVALAPSLIFTYSFLWSEPLFITFSMAALILTARTFRAPTRTNVSYLGILVGLAFLTRYAGATLVFAIAPLILLSPVSVRARIQYLGIFLLFAVAPIGAWLLRNAVVAGSPTGDRPSSASDIVAATRQFASTSASWVIPDRLSTSLVEISILILAIAVLAAFTSAIFRRSISDRQLQYSLPFLAFAALYTVYIVLAKSLTAMDGLGDRLLSPLYIPLVVVLAIAIDSTGRWNQPQVNRLTAAMATVAIVLGLVVSVRGIDTTRKISTDGNGFSSEEWRPFAVSEVLAVPRVGTTFSNQPEAINFFDGSSVRLSPRARAYNSSERVDDIAGLQELLERSGNAHLLWDVRHDQSHLVPLEELIVRFNAQLVTSDGYWSFYEIPGG